MHPDCIGGYTYPMDTNTSTPAAAAAAHYDATVTFTKFARSLVVKGGMNTHDLNRLSALARAAGADPQEARAAVDAGIAREDRARRVALGPI